MYESMMLIDFQFNEETCDQYSQGVDELLNQVTSDSQMTALVGIERRLSDLEKRLNEAKKITKAQADIAQVNYIHKQNKQRNVHCV